MTDLAAKLDEAIRGEIMSDYLIGVAQRCDDCKMGLPCSHGKTIRAAIIAFAREAVREAGCHTNPGAGYVCGYGGEFCTQHRTLTALDELEERAT